MSYRIIPIPESVAEEARRTGEAPGYGHPVHREVAAGYGPCRNCLRPFEANADRRLLFTFDPFSDIESLPLPGPIYVHEARCRAYAQQDQFPELLRFIPITLNAYGRGRHLRDVKYIEPNGDADPAVTQLLSREDVDYIHVRNTEAGCYLFRIERMPDPEML